MDTKKQTYNLDECHLGHRAINLLDETDLTFTEIPKLHIMIASPPVRAVLMVAGALKVPLNLIQVNTLMGEHLSPEYIQKNPQHTIPMLEENGFCVWDSHAISAYLVTCYGKSDDLYPREPRRRATVDQRLHFDSSVLFTSLRSTLLPIFSGKVSSISEEQYGVMNEAIEFLEKFLEGKEWLAGDYITIADICCVSTTSSINEIMPIEHEKYPNVCRWFDKCKLLPYYEENNIEGLKMFGNYVRSLIKE